MDFEKLTSKSKELIQDVINLAAKEKHQYISPEHLLKSLLEDRQIIDLILKSGGSLSQIRRETDAELAKIPAVSGQSVQSMKYQDINRVMRPKSLPTKPMTNMSLWNAFCRRCP